MGIALSHAGSSITFQGGVQYWYDDTCLVIGIVLLAIGVGAAIWGGE